MLRIALLPFIVWMFSEDQYKIAIVLIVISGLSDVLDGKIARKYNMITDLGKVLDPLADKLTQGILLICLALFYYPPLWALIVLFALKELIIVAFGMVVFRKMDVVPSAKWFGKLNSSLLFVAFAIVLLYLLITGTPLPANYAYILTAICGVSMVITMILYLIHFKTLIKAEKNP